MTPEDSLLSIAEIAIGLAGFSGLVAAFSQRPGHAWRGDQKARIVFLVILSFTMMISAILPFALSGIGDSPALIWGVPMVAYSAVALTLLCCWVVVARRRSYRLQFKFVSIPLLAVAGMVQVLVGLSGLGVILPYSPSLFVFGLLATLLFAANLFLALLHITWSDSGEA
jgi:peptidoglycan/LPS O-acetylase OafA/YrhL